MPAFNGQVRRAPVKEIEKEWPETGAGIRSQGHVISASLSVMDAIGVGSDL